MNLRFALGASALLVWMDAVVPSPRSTQVPTQDQAARRLAVQGPLPPVAGGDTGAAGSNSRHERFERRYGRFEREVTVVRAAVRAEELPE